MQDRDKIQRTQNAILGLNCSDSLTLHEWAERMKTKYGSPPFDGNFIDIVEEAFIALHSQGHARQIVRDRSVNKFSKWKVILNSNRIFQIQQICNERGITTLCHFTRVENLHSILQEGLLDRSTLETRAQQFLFNDNDRADWCPEANCLSISFPNYKMFYSIRKGKKADGIKDSQWVILLLNADVLWELDCAFCQTNAASGAVKPLLLNKKIDEKKKLEALKSMFAEDYYDSKRKIQISRQNLQIPDNYTTDPQAEILAFDQIPTKYIKEVHFYEEITREEWLSNNREVYSQTFRSSREYFQGRHDWRSWQKETS